MIQEQVRAWKQLKEMVAKVEDPTLRNAMMAEFRNRAINEWGYCPDDRNATRRDVPALDSCWTTSRSPKRSGWIPEPKNAKLNKKN